MKYFHARGGVVLASVFYILALAVFAIFKSHTAAVFAVLVISVAGGAGIISHGVYYSSLSIVKRYGTGKAKGFSAWSTTLDSRPARSSWAPFWS